MTSFGFPLYSFDFAFDASTSPLPPSFCVCRVYPIRILCVLLYDQPFNSSLSHPPHTLAFCFSFRLSSPFLVDTTLYISYYRSRVCCVLSIVYLFVLLAVSPLNPLSSRTIRTAPRPQTSLVFGRALVRTPHLPTYTHEISSLLRSSITLCI